MLTQQRVGNSVKRKAVEDLSGRPRKVIRRELDSSGLLTLDGDDLVLLRHRVRQKVYPALPTTLAELHINYLNPTTRLEENFLLVNDTENHIVIFSTLKNMQHFATCDTILMDGTFDTLPPFS